MEFRLYSIKIVTTAAQPDKLVRDETGKLRLWDNCGPGIQSLCRLLVENDININACIRITFPLMDILMQVLELQ